MNVTNVMWPTSELCRRGCSPRILAWFALRGRHMGRSL